MTTFKVNEWWGKKYSSKANLFDAGNRGILDMVKEPDAYGAWYTFSKNGKQIARFYQDHTFGFCTQPYGVELSNI